MVARFLGSFKAMKMLEFVWTSIKADEVDSVPEDQIMTALYNRNKVQALPFWPPPSSFLAISSSLSLSLFPVCTHGAVAASKRVCFDVRETTGCERQNRR